MELLSFDPVPENRPVHIFKTSWIDFNKYKSLLTSQHSKFWFLLPPTKIVAIRSPTCITTMPLWTETWCACFMRASMHRNANLNISSSRLSEVCSSWLFEMSMSVLPEPYFSHDWRLWKKHKSSPINNHCQCRTMTPHFCALSPRFGSTSGWLTCICSNRYKNTRRVAWNGNDLCNSK